MPRIYVQFAGMKQLGDAWTAVGSQVNEIQDNFSNTVKSLDWDIKCQSDINSIASRLSGSLENYQQALKSYQSFFQQAYDAYQKLDQNQNSSTYKIAPEQPSGSDFTKWISFGTLIAGSNYGKTIYDVVNGFKNATSWADYVKPGSKGVKFISDLIKDIKNYSKIGNAVGGKTATSWFFRNAFGLKPVGYVSKAKSVTTRFINNLTNKTSPFRKQLTNSVDNFTGKNGIKNAIPSWVSVGITGVCNWFSNKEEQAASGGSMSDGRVVAETVVETVVDTAASIGIQAVIGAAVTAVGGTVAAPAVVVAAASGLVIAGGNALIEHFTGKTATEWASDFILDGGQAIAEGIGNAATAVSNAVGGWFNKIFA